MQFSEEDTRDCIEALARVEAGPPSEDGLEPPDGALCNSPRARTRHSRHAIKHWLVCGAGGSSRGSRPSGVRLPEPGEIRSSRRRYRSSSHPQRD